MTQHRQPAPSHVTKHSQSIGCTALRAAALAFALGAYGVTTIAADLPETKASSAATAKAKRCYRFAKDLSGNSLALNTAPVCKAFLRNLNEFCDEPPMACELKIHRKYSMLLGQPKWKRISATPTIEEIERFIKAPDHATGIPQRAETIWAVWLPTIEAAIQRGSLTVNEAYVDLLNRGYKERVLRIQTGECTSKNHATSDSDHALMYQTDGIYANLAPEVYARHPGHEYSWGGGIVFTFNKSTYEYGMGLDTIVINRSDDSTDRIIGSHKGVCVIQMIYKEAK
jgi:hypothetical protein